MYIFKYKNVIAAAETKLAFLGPILKRGYRTI